MMRAPGSLDAIAAPSAASTASSRRAGSSIRASYSSVSGPGHAVALDDVDVRAVKVAGLVQPELIGQRDDVGDQRVALPPIARVAHPPVGVVEVRPRVRVEDAKRVILLVDDREVARALKNLQRRREIRRARNTGLIALDRRIGGRASSIVLVSPSERLRFVRNLPVGRIDDDALRTRRCPSRPRWPSMFT